MSSAKRPLATARRLAFLRALVERGAFTRIPEDVPWPTINSIASMRAAGWIELKSVGPRTPDKRGRLTQTVEFHVTKLGRALLEKSNAR